MDNAPDLRLRAPDWTASVASSFCARRPPLLEEHEVHVWRAALDLQVSQVLNLQRNLSEDEHARVPQFHFQRDRDRFIVARGLLRLILAGYLNMKPGSLRFCYGPRGKPVLAMHSGGEGLHFNVSHSDGLALYAVSRGRELGVDVERIRPHLVNEDVAEQFFSPRETAILRALPPAARQEAFFAFWTRKEAYIKARGEGFSISPNQVDVSQAFGDQPISVGTDGDRQEVSQWSLTDLIPGPGFAAALAVEHQGWRLKRWQW